ncbi:MAG: Ig-like domain-containing protein, partial [Polyangiaceae bacterium]
SPGSSLMNRLHPSFVFVAIAALSVVTGCSGSSDSTSGPTEANPFTGSLIADTDPADGATGVDGDATIEVHFNQSVDTPFTMGDSRLFHVLLVQAVITNTDTGVIFATANDGVWEDDKTFALSSSTSDPLQCNANYSIDVKVRVEESKDNGNTWYKPGFGSLEETKDTTFQAGSSYC